MKQNTQDISNNGRSDSQPTLGGLEVYRIGRIGKTHGVRGEVSFQFDDDVFDRVDAEYLVLDVDGILVPFFMEEYRFRSDSLALVKFCDIDTQERAHELTGCDVYFPLSLIPDDDEAPLTLSFLVGFTVIDAQTGKSVGRIASVDDSTANVLFELEDGTLIPANDDLVTGIDQKKRILTIALPEGLLEL
jgi:16S rRNA processing protein RimM